MKLKIGPFVRGVAAACVSVGALAIAMRLSAAPADAFELHSAAIGVDGKLPAEFTCDGARATLPLEWVHVPARTKSFALTMHHVPGPGDQHVYWVLYNIPADTRSLAKNAGDIGVRGINTVNSRTEYAPPCSKGPGMKKYTLTVYALSAEPKINVQPSAVTMDVLLAAIQDRTLATAAMDVTYTRPAKTSSGAVPQVPPTPTEPRGAQAGGPPMEQALRELTLSEEQKAKAAPILKQYREHMEQLRQQRDAFNDQLLAGLKEILEAKQMEKLESAAKKRPGPPPTAPPPPGGEKRGE